MTEVSDERRRKTYTQCRQAKYDSSDMSVFVNIKCNTFVCFTNIRLAGSVR